MDETKNAGRWTPPRVRLIALVYVLLLVFNAFDAHSTVAAVRQGATELNPVMAALLARGAWTFVAAKMAGVAALGLVLAFFARTTRIGRHLLSRQERRLAWIALICLTGAYGLVFVWQVALALCGSHVMIVIPS